MKKIFLSIVAVTLFSLISQAQFRIGVKAGASTFRQRVNVASGNVFSNDHYKSYHAGLVSEFRIAENFYLQPQVVYTRLGGTLLHSTGQADTKVRTNVLDVPVNVVYKLPVSFGKIFAGAGPSFSYSFGGRQEQDGQKSGLYGSKGAWKREDIGLHFTAGVEFNNGLYASVNSQKGLLDTYKAENISIKNRAVSLSVGYLIDWSKLKKKS